MSEHPKSFFFSATLGALPRQDSRTRVSSKVEATTPVPELSAYDRLIAALGPDEKAQLERIAPFIQNLISHLQRKYKSPEFAGVIIERDTLRFDFPEQLHPAVLSVFTLVMSQEYQRALDEHNAGIPAPKRVRADLDKLN